VLRAGLHRLVTANWMKRGPTASWPWV